MIAHRLDLAFLPDLYAICRLSRDEPVPLECNGPFLSITRTNEELSIVCNQSAAPAGAKCEHDWRCLRVAGTLPFSTTGVLASLADPLAEAGIPVFAVSTFDTDYLLIREKDVEKSIEVLRRAGHSFVI
jgi:uncharacterized protein